MEGAYSKDHNINISTWDKQAVNSWQHDQNVKNKTKTEAGLRPVLS